MLDLVSGGDTERVHVCSSAFMSVDASYCCWARCCVSVAATPAPQNSCRKCHIKVTQMALAFSILKWHLFGPFKVDDVNHIIFMFALPEDIAERMDRPVSNLFAEADRLEVESSSVFSCATEVPTNSAASYIVEAHSCQRGSSDATTGRQKCVYRVYHAIGERFDIKKSLGKEMVTEITIPNSVRELSGSYLDKSKNLRCVILGASSELVRIGKYVFRSTSIESLTIPDSVVELCDGCCCHCKSLRRLIFGKSSNVKRIGDNAFCETGIESLDIPDSVVEIGDSAFNMCEHLRIITFGESSQLEYIHNWAFRAAKIRSLAIPDSVVALGYKCFFSCRHLHSVTFGVASKLQRLGGGVFCWTNVESLTLPDSVVELGDSCFYGCSTLHCVTFRASSMLERIGELAFCRTRVDRSCIPDYVAERCHNCF